MYETIDQVVAGLKAFRDHYGPKSSSVAVASNRGRDIDADPFRRGFLDSIEARTQMLQRLATLDERERAILMLFYVADLPARDVCDRLRLSRSHAYRLRDKALTQMLGTHAEELQAVS